MPRRIVVPDADALFGTPAPPERSATRRRGTAPRPEAAAALPRRRAAAPAETSAAPARAAKGRQQSRARRPPASLEARVAAVEGRLAELPTDILIDLHDRAAELLAGDSVDNPAVTRLLDSLRL